MPQIKPNLNYIKKIADGDNNIERKLISIIKNEFPTEKKEFEQQLLDKKLTQASFTVHKLKHKFVVLGFESQYELINNFEKQLQNSNTALLPEFKTILSQLELFVGQL
ncbi:MAG: Hpt domain-containing protein [Flavobacteriaceae bacterium]